MHQMYRNLIVMMAFCSSLFLPLMASAQYVPIHDNNGNLKPHGVLEYERREAERRSRESKVSYKNSAGFSYGSSENVFTLGYKVGGMGLAGLNKAVAAYNSDRAWLSTKMPEFGVLTGWEASWQYRGRKWGFETVIGKISEKNDAQGMEPATSKMGYRRAKVSMGGFSMGIMRRIYEREHLSILPSLDFDAYWFSGSSLYSSTDSYSGVTPQNEVSEIMLANTLSLNVSLFIANWLGINLKPYVQIPWGSANLQGIVPYNGVVAAQDDKPVNAGVSASLIIALGRSD